MNKLFVMIASMLLANVAHAIGLNVSFAPYAKINGDSDEGGMYVDSYDEFDLGTGKAGSLELYVGDVNQWYAEYTFVQLDDSDRAIPSVPFSTMVVGSRLHQENELNDIYSAYYDISFGVGYARFDLEKERYKALTEVKFDIGIVINDLVTFGPGMKYQIIGYPSETMATDYSFYLKLGVKF